MDEFPGRVLCWSGRPCAALARAEMVFLAVARDLEKA